VLRSLAPSELLVDDKGYVLVGSYVNCKLLEKSDRTYTLCGTPEYLSPEQIDGIEGHGLPADWWALGVLLYTLRCGQPPFGTGNELSIFKKVTDHAPGELPFDGVDGPVDPDFYQLCNGLCHPKEEARLGSSGAAQVRTHRWLSGVDWEGMQQGSASSPFVGACSKRLQELTAADEGGGSTHRLITKLGATSDHPPSQSLFELFGTIHPKTGTGFVSGLQSARRRSVI